MKKVFLLLAISALLFSCSQLEKQKTEYDNSDVKNVSIVEIDSCEYIQYSIGTYNGRQNLITHKGNCKYCISRNK